MRYILALMPSKQYLLACIQAAQQVFSPINDGYLLTENKSIPHVTVCAFQCDESKIQEIWLHVQQWQISNCPLHMTGLMLKKGKTPTHHYSVGLSVARDPQLLHLHYLGLELLESYGITILNPSRESYQPHLTLAGIGWLPEKEVILPFVIDDLLSMPTQHFHIVLGRGDDIGQYIETIYEF